MRLAFVALALALPAASSAGAPIAPRAANAAAPARLCLDRFKVTPVKGPAPPRLKSLGELPPGDLTLTLVNQVGDCIEPVVVRQGFGGTDFGNGR
jgi:hypothetical protein